MSTSFKSSTGDGSIIADDFHLSDGTKLQDLIPFKKIVVAYNSDLNTLIEDGYYFSDGAGSGGPQNGPAGAVFSDWSCSVNKFNGVTVQEFSLLTGATYTRLRNAGGTWLSWGATFFGGNGNNNVSTFAFSGITALDGGATLADVITKVNAIIAKLQSGL